MTPRTLLCAVFFAVGLLVQGQADAAGDVVIQNFGTAPNGNLSASTLIADAAGNLYGTTSSGGLNRLGTAFKLSPPKAGGTAWTQTVIYNFGSDYLGESQR